MTDREPNKFICGCGRVGVHRVKDGRGRCTLTAWTEVNPRWRRWQARHIRRRFKVGVSVASLSRSHGRRCVLDAIREGL